PEIVRVRTPPDRKQHVAADDFRWTFGTVDTDGNSLGVWRKSDAFGVGVDGDTFGFQERPDFQRNVFVLPRDQATTLFDNRDLRSKAPVYLRELQPDIAATNNHKMVGQHVGLEQRTVGEIRDVTHTLQVRNQSPSTNIDKDAIRLKQFLTNPDGMGA